MHPITLVYLMVNRTANVPLTPVIFNAPYFSISVISLCLCQTILLIIRQIRESCVLMG